MALSTIIQPIAEIVNKLIPDGAEKNRLQAQLEQASLEVDKQRLGALSNMLGSNSWFVAGAIPSILWVLVISVINNYILMPWAKVFGLTVPDVSLPSEYWTLVGWIITGLLAKKAIDGNAIYSRDGSLIKPSRTDEGCNSYVGLQQVVEMPQTESRVITVNPPIFETTRAPKTSNTTVQSGSKQNESKTTYSMNPPEPKVEDKNQEYYQQRFDDLANKYK